MKDAILKISRRHILEASLLVPFIGRAAAQQPTRGGRLIVGQCPEPLTLTSAITTAGPTQFVSSKIFDGLLEYTADMTPRPKLATGWSTSKDGLAITFQLRPDVTWHDGKPFSADDVAFSVMEVWKKYHSRGRSTFASVEAVDTPNATTAILRLKQPAPFILSAMSSLESQVVPKHLYAQGNVLTNPANIAPVGNGPYRLKQWDRGNFIILERNPQYWGSGRPRLGTVIFRIIPDPSAHAEALQAGEIQASAFVELTDIQRLVSTGLVADRGVHACAEGGWGLEFNLDRHPFGDVRVRQAIAHAVDLDFIAQTIWSGFARPSTGPIPRSIAAFYTDDVPRYPYDLKTAAALLDQAGLKPDASGKRFSFTIDPVPVASAQQRTAEYIRDSLSKIGVEVSVRMQDFGSFIYRAYSKRDFDVLITGGQMGPDPAIGTQRFYWSKSFSPGVAFTNTSHYASATADQALEDAQHAVAIETRREAYHRFQKIAQADLPRIPLVEASAPSVYTQQVHELIDPAQGLYGSFADTWIG